MELPARSTLSVAHCLRCFCCYVRMRGHGRRSSANGPEGDKQWLPRLLTFWTITSGISAAIQAVAALVVAAVAIWAYFTARDQLTATKIDRTTRVLEETSSEDMEFVFGFFDVSADLRASRAACTELFERLVLSRPEPLRIVQETLTRPAIDAAIEEMLEDLDRSIDTAEKIEEPNDRLREQEFRNRLITVANVCEKVWVLSNARAIDLELFLGDQDYNVASTYYVLEEVLRYLVREEYFNFDDFRSIAILARAHHARRSDGNKDLVRAEFAALACDKEHASGPLAGSRRER